MPSKFEKNAQSFAKSSFILVIYFCFVGIYSNKFINLVKDEEYKVLVKLYLKVSYVFKSFTTSTFRFYLCIATELCL